MQRIATLLTLALAFPTITGPPSAARAGEAWPQPVQDLALAIGFPTISHQDPERLDAEAFEAFLGFIENRYPRVFDTLQVRRVNEYSVVLRWPGAQPEFPAVLVDAHYDVVPVEPTTRDDWTHPPFEGVIEDGFVWGRGAIDDKAAVITLLSAAERLLERGFTPERTLYLTLVHDEEVGGREGAGRVVEDLLERGQAFHYVIGEGSGMIEVFPLLPGRRVAMINLAEKGFLTLHLTATGPGGHSSMPPRESSIVRLAEAVTALHENPFAARLAPPVDAMLAAVGEHTDGFGGFLMRNQWLSSGILARQLASDPLGASMVRTTTAVTIFEAGVKDNVVPQYASARVNFRLLPGDTPEALIARVEALVDDPGIEIESAPWQGTPGIANVEGPGYARLRAAIEAILPETVVVPGLLIATTDSRHYARLSQDVYRFRPWSMGASDAARIHGTDERISIESVLQSVTLWQEVLQGAAAP